MSGITNKSWSNQRAVPGSIKPVYGAQYPPLTLDPSIPLNNKQVSGSPVRRISLSESTDDHTSAGKTFASYVNSVSDAWDDGIGNVINRSAAEDSAAKVLAQHAAVHHRNEEVMLNLPSGTPSRNSRAEGLKKLAVQKDCLPSSSTSTSVIDMPLYPRLTDTSEPGSSSKLYPNPTTSKSRTGSNNIHSQTSSNKETSSDLVRFSRLETLLSSHSNEVIDLNQLKKDCWRGIPHKLRPTAWRLLSGYLPANLERRDVTLSRKREEYFHYVEQYFYTRHDDQHQETFRQIHIDIPRMCPLVSLFQQKQVQEIFERILYIWAIRHPASGYVQGINDLVTPFFIVFLSEFVKEDTEVGNYDVCQLPREHIEIVEADSFWCVSALLDTIQDNYTFAQPGIQKKVTQLHNLLSRIDNTLHQHMENHEVEYLQFAFRWMNNVLMREIPLRATIRLWDTYLSEPNGFSDFHVYVCVAFLRMWSKQLQQKKDFQNMMIFLQNLPTQGWSDQQICELTADAYSLMCLFAGAKNHLNQQPIIHSY